MPAAAPPPRPRNPQGPFPLTNGTIGASPTPITIITTSPNAPAGTKPPAASASEQTPSSFPSMIFAPVNFAPVGQIPEAKIDSTPVPTYPGSTANILAGSLCRAKLHHPRWPDCAVGTGGRVHIVQVGVLPLANAHRSSRSRCSVGDRGGRRHRRAEQWREAWSLSDQRAARPGQDSGMSERLPYGHGEQRHSMLSILGGQVPCYSSLNKALVPPPMPDTLAYAGLTASVGSRSSGSGGSITPAPSPNYAGIIGQGKPTSAVVNVAYAMQYQLAEEKEAALKTPARIGVGIGAAAGGVFILVVIMFLAKRCLSKKRTKVGGYEGGGGSQSSHGPVGVTVAKTHGGMKYAGVSTSAVDG